MDNKKISTLLNTGKLILASILKRLSSSDTRKENNLVDLQKYLFLKKLKSDTELQILKVSQFLNTFPKNYKLIPKIEESKNPEENLSEIIRIFKVHQENKDKKEILKIKNLFVSIGLHKLFEFPNYNEQMIEKSMIYFCINCKMKLFKRNSIIYNIDDTFDKFYIMISGKIGMYKILEKVVNFSGISYFQYIFDLHIKKEKYLLKLTLEKNYKLFPINEEMMDDLNINLAKYIIYHCQKNQDYLNIYGSKEEILKMCFLNPKEYTNIKLDIEENIENNLIYKLLSKTRDKNNIYIYEYLPKELYTTKKVLEEFNNNDILLKYKTGNNTINYEYNITSKRNYTLKALSETYICYIDLQEYIYFFIEEYKLYMREQALFLVHNFIFQKIQKHFELHYFNFFEFEEVKSNQFLFHENDKVEYIYLLKEGIVELTINKNIFKIREIINKLNSQNDISDSFNENNNFEKNLELELGHEFFNEKKKLNENKNEKIVVLEKNQIIGLECLYLGINYFYNAKLGNKNAKFYKIKKDKFLEIIDLEQRFGIHLDYQKEAQRKINFFLLRLINLIKVKINCIKSKKIPNIINIYNQINIGRNYKKVKFNLTHKKTRYKLNSTNIDNIPLNNYKLNIGTNNFELTNSKSNLNNKTENNSKSTNPKIKIKNIKNILINRRNNTESNLEIYRVKELMKNNKSVNKITFDNNIFLSLRNEERLVNRLNQKLSNDKLFFSKIKKENKFKNLKLIEKIKTLKINNSYNGDIYDHWKTFHLNINIDSASHKKRLERINWYKNIDKFPFKTDENNEEKTNNLVYGIQVNKAKVTFVKEKILFKNYSYFSPT